MQFATCDGVKTEMSFVIYIKTYGFSSWLWLLFYAFLFLPISLVLTLLIKKVPKNVMLYLSKQIFSSSMSSLVEVSSHINEATLLQFELRHMFRIIFGVWVLALVVVIIAYTRLFTSFVLAPLKPTHSWNRISAGQLFNHWQTVSTVVS